MLIDTHCHLDFERFDADRDAVVERMLESGVGRVIVPALDPENWQVVVGLADKYESVYAAVGVHPNSSANWDDAWLEVLRSLASHDKVVAIGEIGLDYYWDKSPKAVQQRAFRLQLDLAHQLALPVIIHNRETDTDMLQMLRDAPQVGSENPGVLHSFSSSWSVAEQVLDLGYYLGFTGPVTYKKADDLRDVVRKMPANRLLIETDAPFLAPQKYRGKRNEPAYVALVAERIAQERGVSLAELARITTANAQRLFGQL
jgi:TatD DNase family protein